jgi:microcin C transport system substrate-binding protein
LFSLKHISNLFNLEPHDRRSPFAWPFAITPVAMTTLALMTCLVAWIAGLTPVSAQTGQHGISLFGQPELPKNFKHFPYVNAKAPKGGELRLSAIGSFDNLNPFTIKGQAATGLSMIYDTLLSASYNEASASYGLLAETIAIAEDGLSVTFTLRKQAKFFDGEPVTADDVVWSVREIRAAHPFYNAYYRDIADVTAIGKNKVKFTFSQGGNRELPFIIGQLPILPSHYWQTPDRSLKDTTLDIPFGSGPYQIDRIIAGRTIVFKRNADYWAKDLNITQGRFNFDYIRYEYFGDDTIAFEALKAGELDFRTEFSSKNWATGYDIDAVKNAQLQREEITIDTGSGMQAFVFNTRRAPFDDRKFREALNYAFDFEWTNKTLFYGQYKRTNSFFEGSELAASGLPSAAELALLEPYRDILPPELFTSEFSNPESDGSGNIRPQLRIARGLLEEAGWNVTAGKLEKNGENLEIEFLLAQPSFERIIAPYIRNLAKLGIDAKIRVVDPTQYQNRVNEFDYDAVVMTFAQSLSPGNEQRDYWSSQSADRQGGRNFIGIKSPVVDALIEKIIFADTRKDQLTATHALDRVLLWNHYVVPQWHAPHERLAYWTGLSHPDPMPKFSIGFPDIWWRDGTPPYSQNATEQGTTTP